MKTRNRLLSLMLAFCMVLTLFPSTALADDTVQAEPGTVISTDGYYTSLIDENGILWTWGDSIYNDNQLGNGTTGGSNAPVKVIENAVSVVREKQFSEGSNAVITSDGSLWMWGQNRWGQLGIGTCESSSVPVKVLDNVASVSLGGMRTAAVKTDGSLWTWGNAQGSVWAMLGNGTEEGSLVPIKVMDGVASVSCGAQHIAALKTDGSLWLWGDGSALGRGDITDLAKDEPWHSPVPIKIMDNVAHVCAGNTATVVIKTDGSLWAWGSDDYGILGDGLTDHAYWPVKVMDNVSSVTLYKGTGYPAVAAIKNDGSLWMWGSNNCGRLGNGTTQDSHIPVKILDDVASVSVGVSHTAAIKKDGSLWTWGWNRYGQLGTGTSQDSLIPVKVMDNAAVVALEVNNTFVGKTDRTVWVFGANTSGTLGLGFAGNSINVPTQNKSLTVKVPGPVTPPGPGVDPDPGPDTPPEPTGSAAITALYPANGTTFDFADTSSDTRMRIFFDREVSDGGGGRPELDFSVGTLEVHKASDDSIVYQVQYGTEVSLWNVDGSPTAVVLKNATAALDYDTEYYVTMPEGFIKMADGSVSPAVEKGKWEFTTADRNEEILPEIVSPEIIRGEFSHLSSVKENGQTVTRKYNFSYNDSWFMDSSYNYQHDLATMSLCVAMAAYGSGESDRAKNIKDLMTDLHFQFDSEESVNYPTPEYDSIGYAIGRKNIRFDSGEDVTLILVAIRGGDYGIEWGGNFKVGNGINHEGFDTAAKKVIQALDSYIRANKEELRPNVKVWLTGYSRAAATTNLVAKELDDGVLKSANFKQEDIFAFCFECPQNTRAKDTKDEKYNNIVNIVNPNDFVTKVAMSAPSWLWGYTRYGRTLYLPYEFNGAQYANQYNRMSGAYYYLTGQEPLLEFPGQSVILDDFMKDLASTLITPSVYTAIYQSSFADTGSLLGGGKITYRDIFALPPMIRLAGTHPISTGQTISLFATECAQKAHYAELCLAWMNSLNGDLNEFSSLLYRKTFINCPVDVEVLDKDNAIVAKILNNSAENLTADVMAYIDDDGQKVVILPCNEEYTIKMVANSNGTVTYTATEYNMDSGETEKLVSYYQVEVDAEDVLTGFVENLDKVTSASYPLYLNDSDESLTPSVNQSADAVQEFSVDVSSFGNGTVAGGGSYISGEFAKVTATANSGETFLGWYVDNTRVSADMEYRFLVNQNVSITAKFTQSSTNPDPTNPIPSYPTGGSSSGPSISTTYAITIPDFAGGSITATPKSASKGKTVTLTVAPNEGYEIATLTVTDTKGNELELANKGGGKYTFVMPDSKVTVAAVFQLIQQDDSQHPQDPSWINPFTDVSESSWYYDAVRFVNENGLMNGISSTTFAPDANLSRAQLAQILYNKESKPAVNGSSPFTDVAAGAWYSDAVTWAAANSIVGGYGNGLFGPDDNITREQLAVMLWRYAGETVANIEIAFNDADQISGFAQAAIRWAVENGILNGKGNNILDPKGYATRAEVAQMLKNYLG